MVATVPPDVFDPGATWVEPSVWMVPLSWPSTFCAVMRHCVSSCAYTACARYLPPSTVRCTPSPARIVTSLPVSSGRFWANLPSVSAKSLWASTYSAFGCLAMTPAATAFTAAAPSSMLSSLRIGAPTQ